jgi:RNA polymerase sigma-70 factor, ECF subfamily
VGNTLELSERRATTSTFDRRDGCPCAPAPVVAESSDEREVPEQCDAALILGVARRDRRAFETLYYRHAARLRRYLARMLHRPEWVDESLNDVMLAIWQSAARFDPAIGSPVTWFLAIAHNKALKMFAKQGAASIEVAFDSLDMGDVEKRDGSEMVGPVDAETPERTLLGREIGQLLDDALELLSLEHRTVIELAFGEDRSYAEIASITSVPLNTVKTRMFYARRHLADILRRQGVLGASTFFGAAT